MTASRAKETGLTSKTPSPTLASYFMCPESDVKETDATIRYTGPQLQMCAEIIDPEKYINILKHWKWIANGSSTLDYYSAHQRSITRIEWEHKWKLLDAGVIHLIFGDFDPIIPPPTWVERIAFIHDMGRLHGLFRKRQDAKTQVANPNKYDVAIDSALKRLSDPLEISRCGTGDIVDDANPNLPGRPGNMYSSDVDIVRIEFVLEESDIRVPGHDHVGQFFVLSQQLYTKLPKTVWEVYHQSLKSALGVGVTMNITMNKTVKN